MMFNKNIVLIIGLDTMIITIIIQCMLKQRKANQKKQQSRRRKSLKPPLLIKGDPFLNGYLNLFVPDFCRTVMCGIWIQVVLNT